MIKNRIILVSIFLNIVYGIVLINISGIIILIAHYFGIPYVSSLIFVVAFFVFEFLLFFSYIPSIGILVLSAIAVIPYIFIKNIGFAEIPTIPIRLKKSISNISEETLIKLIKNDSILYQTDDKKSIKSDNHSQK